MDQARYDLKNFSRELKDVDMGLDLSIEIGEFLAFADWFFDGFVVDFMVQSRINKAASQVDEAIRRVKAIVEQLERY